MMKRRKGIACRLSISIFLSTAAIFILIFGYNYNKSMQLILQEKEQEARSQALANGNNIESQLRAIQKLPLSLVSLLNKVDPDTSIIEAMIKDMVNKNQEIYGAGITFQPYAFSKSVQYYSPYFCRKGREIQLIPDPSPQINYTQDWYRIPYLKKAPVWSEPYFDDSIGGGGIVMCSYSFPFFKTDSIAAIIVIDIDISMLHEIVSTAGTRTEWRKFLISENGTFIAFSDSEYSNLVLHKTIFDISQERNDNKLQLVGKSMIRGDTGFVRIKNLFNVENGLMVYIPLQQQKWSLGVLFPVPDLMADIIALSREILVLCFVGICVLLLVTIIIAGTITRPLRMLVKTTEEIAKGNLNCTIPLYTTGDEIGRLGQSFATMRDALKVQIEELTTATAIKERIESELKIAHDIQTDMLPRIFPPFPDRKELDLYAMIQPAREVGGDFFDFFFTDDRHLFFYIADVAGKGVPASLFMAVSRTLIKTKCASGLSVEQVMACVNNDLCMDNEACMFVTLFCGMLDVQTGKLVYVNGGHNPPLLRRDGSDFDFIPVHKGIALGVMSGISFSPQFMDLSSGDTVFLYTDGVNEALNSTNQLFGTERLIQALNDKRDDFTRELINRVYSSIVHFTEGEEQSDDITMLALRYIGA